MRRASSILLLLLLQRAGAEGFGRFGYTDRPTMPDLQLTPEGFGGIEFFERAPAWKVVVADEMGATIGMGQGASGPTKARLSLLSPGIGLWFADGLKLRVGSIAAPYLTWPEGSVRNGVPTAASPWLVLSFSEPRPPIMLGFPGGPTALKVTGRPGDWLIEGPEHFQGWLRAALPIGSRNLAANSPSALGKLAQQSAAIAPLITGSMPSLTGTRVVADGAGVTATWKYDAKNVVLPRAAFLAELGGYGLRVQSPVVRPDAPTADGPLIYTPGDELTIRFPIRRIPTGRAVSVGGEPASIGTVSPFDAPSVTELALENLLATSDSAARAAAETASGDWIGEATATVEPNTGQNLLYGAGGEGIDLAAAHALLNQSLVTSKRATSEANSLLTSLAWRRDWSSWQIWVPDEALARRAGAMAALAAAICPEPERRLDAALFEAGLAAQRGLDIWRRRRGDISVEPTREQPYQSLRSGLFGKGNDPFATLLQSPLRVYGDAAVRAEIRPEGVALSWPVVEVKADSLSLACGFPLKVVPNGNFGQFRLAQALGISEVRYLPETAGICEILLGPAGNLPAWAPPPRR